MTPQINCQHTQHTKHHASTSTTATDATTNTTPTYSKQKEKNNDPPNMHRSRNRLRPRIQTRQNRCRCICLLHKIHRYHNKGVQQEGRFLTEALELYLKLTEISAKVENKETQTKKKITINTNKTYPQTHQKFKKYLQKKYKTKNIKNQDYNNEFNAAITIYTPILQEIAKEKEVDVYDLF